VAFYAGFVTGLGVAGAVFCALLAAAAILGARAARPKIDPSQAAAIAAALRQAGGGQP